MERREAFFTLHRDLPRQSPGHPESTAAALFMVPRLPARPRILDLGCGPGAQTLDLARLLPDATLVAVDTHPPFVQEVRRRAEAEGMGDRITAEVGDMADPPPGPFDLIWCEGAVYFLGFEAALARWSPRLTPDGAIALTDAVWLGPTPSPRIAAMWEEYPDMAPLELRRRQVAQAGLVLHGDFVLPDRDWWELYYDPLAARIAALRPGADPVLSEVLDEADEEIAVRRLGAETYGYAFFVVGPPEDR